MTQLSDPIAREIEDLERLFSASVLEVPGPTLPIDARVRGVPVTIRVDLESYPQSAPTVVVHEGWTWNHPKASIDHKRRIVGLRTLEKWNRTLGLAAVLRELGTLFRECSPQKEPARINFVAWLLSRVSRG